MRFIYCDLFIIMQSWYQEMAKLKAKFESLQRSQRFSYLFSAKNISNIDILIVYLLALHKYLTLVICDNIDRYHFRYIYLKKYLHYSKYYWFL